MSILGVLQRFHLESSFQKKFRLWKKILKYEITQILYFILKNTIWCGVDLMSMWGQFNVDVGHWYMGPLVCTLLSAFWSVVISTLHYPWDLWVRF
jgi:hypothetical protein